MRQMIALKYGTSELNHWIGQKPDTNIRYIKNKIFNFEYFIKP